MTNLGDALTDDLTFLAICWRIIRSDGVALGFTTHDRPLVVGGLRYESAPGMVPSAIVAGDDLEVDTMDVAGALTGDAISAADLRAGRYDDAAVRVFFVDWRNPDGGQQRLIDGRIGTVEAGSRADSGFVASLRGPTAALAITAVETYAPECRAELGDSRCRVAMRGRRVRSVVASGQNVAVVPAQLADPIDDFVDGRLRVLDGAEAGIGRRIVATEGGALLVDEALALRPGTRIELWQGCDKRLATCAGRFSNALNFRGEPHVPGADILTRFGA